MFGKVETLTVMGVSYGLTFLASVGASSGAPVESPHLFWPAFLGAALAGLMTLAPMFDEKSELLVAAVAFKAAVTIFSGFLFAYFGAESIARLIEKFMFAGAAIDLKFIALGCGVTGEKIMFALFSASPAKIHEWIFSGRGSGPKR